MNILKDNGKGFTTIVSPTAQTSTNSYADVSGSQLDTGDKSIGSVAFAIHNTHAANHIYWKVLASVDGTNYVIVNAESQVDANDAEVESYSVQSAPFRYYKVQVKTVSAGNHGTAVVSGIAK